MSTKYFHPFYRLFLKVIKIFQCIQTVGRIKVCIFTHNYYFHCCYCFYKIFAYTAGLYSLTLTILTFLEYELNSSFVSASCVALTSLDIVSGTLKAEFNELYFLPEVPAIFRVLQVNLVDPQLKHAFALWEL